MIKYLPALLVLASGPAYADALSDARAKADAYRASQPSFAYGGGSVSTSAVGGEGTDEDITYRNVVIGDGQDPTTGSIKSNCWDTDNVHVDTQVLDTGASGYELVHTNYELTSYLQSQSTLTVSGGVGPFSVAGDGLFKLTKEFNESVDNLSIVAHYEYIRGARRLVGPFPPLAPAYQALLEQNPAMFLQECGAAFLQEVQDGIALYVIFSLHKRKDIEATEDEIKAALSARYGLSEGRGTETLTERERSVLEAYDVASKCLVRGGKSDVCQLIDTSAGVQGAWSRLVAGNSYVAIKTGFTAYEALIPSPSLHAYRDRLTVLEQWEQQRSTVRYICSSLPYIGSAVCGAASTEIDAREQEVQDWGAAYRSPNTLDHSPDVQLETGDQAAIINQAFLGGVMFCEGAHYGGTCIPVRFSVIDPQGQGLLEPDHAYRLERYAFRNVTSSVIMMLSRPEEWELILYSNDDGTGDEWKVDKSMDFLGDFNDRARSFRLVRTR